VNIVGCFIALFFSCFVLFVIVLCSLFDCSIVVGLLNFYGNVNRRYVEAKGFDLIINSRMVLTRVSFIFPHRAVDNLKWDSHFTVSSLSLRVVMVDEVSAKAYSVDERLIDRACE
jgi:hypothetical protein